MPTLRGVNPILVVTDLEASILYYTQKLGFHRNWATPTFASVFREHTNLFLSVDDQGHTGTWVWVSTDNVEALHTEYQASGAVIRHPPTNYDWALEMQVEDPDGNVLRIGSDNRPDQPTGDWLDMHGKRWESTGPNQWTLIEPD